MNPHPSLTYREYEFWWRSVPPASTVISRNWDEFRANTFLRGLSIDPAFLASVRHMLRDREVIVLASQSSRDYVIARMASYISRSQILITMRSVAALEPGPYTRLPKETLVSSVGLTRIQKGSSLMSVPPPNGEASPLPLEADEIACAAVLRMAAANSVPFCEL